MAQVRKRRNSQRIREAALRAARKVFLERGYDATLDEIAETAGVARRSLYYIYGSKDNLFLSVFEDLMELEDLTGTLDPEAEPRRVLARFGRNYLARILSKEQVAFHRLLIAEQKRFPDGVRKVATMHFARILPPFKAYFATLMAGGRFRACDPEFATEQFLTMLVGYARVRILLGLDEKRAQRARYIDASIATFLLGMESRTGNSARRDRRPRSPRPKTA